MSLEVVLNELSFNSLAPDINTARDRMSNLIETLILIQDNAKSITPYTHYEFHSTVLAPNYFLYSWLQDKAVDRDTQRFILTLANQPFTEDINTENYEFSHEGEAVIGLGVAYLLDALSISLLSEERWNCSFLSLDVVRIDEHDELLEEAIELLHVSCSNHVIEHTDWIQNCIRIEIRDGIELWDRQKDLFPNLEFCDAVQKQFHNIKRGQVELRLVKEALVNLDSCCQNWATGFFSTEGYSLDVSGESKPTIQKYGKDRTFHCLDGQDRLFEQHIKLKVCNWRIHFFPQEAGEKIIVGYVGRHLPTVNYPT
ncbi:MAG: hypothetical protein WBA77_05255 [Microcoleaceae cyanobacterium]